MTSAVLPPAHQSREEAIDSILSDLGDTLTRYTIDFNPECHLQPEDAHLPGIYDYDGVELYLAADITASEMRALLQEAYDLGYQAAVLEAQARAIENGARGGSRKTPAQQRQTARLNGTLTPTSASAPRMAPGNPWTEEEDAAVLRGEFPETHTRGACYARRSRLRRQATNLGA